MKKLLTAILLLLVILTGMSFAETPLTIEEVEWLEANKGKTFVLGFSPYSGMDYFELNGTTYGYLIDVIKLFNNETGLNIVIDDTLTWGTAYAGLLEGDIEVLFGANPTEERLKIMAFTQPIHKYPYAILTRGDSAVTTIGDMDNKAVGFIEGDIVKEAFSHLYNNIDVHPVLYRDQMKGMEALVDGDIDAFITSGGEVVWDYLYLHPQIHKIADLSTIHSEMTFSTLKENKILVSILDKIIFDRQEVIESKVTHSRQRYVRKILRLTEEEQAWLDSDTRLVVGVPNDYLPIDYFEDGRYTGVAGEYLNQYADLLGVELSVKPGSFDEIYKELEAGSVDILNMAKTDDRLKMYSYTNAFSDERDVIYGLKNSEYTQDIYGLEGARIAVIEGFWHEEHLMKNLQDIEIIITRDITETLDLINQKEVDYFIENPTVAEYYIDQLGYSHIVKRGETSSDSYLYFGTCSENQPFIGTFNKAMVLLDFELAKYEGIQNAPALENIFNKRLRQWIAILGMVLILISYYLFKMIRASIKREADLIVMKEREKMMYTDFLTGINNRYYFNEYSKILDDLNYPQAMIVMDLNDLKVTNDTYGHQAGDLYIKCFADTLLEIVDKENLMRMGGDEFLICLPEASMEEVLKIIEKIKQTTEETMLNIGQGISIRGPYPSIGFAIRSDSDKSVDELFNEADQNMYLDKEKQKYRVWMSSQ